MKNRIKKLLHSSLIVFISIAVNFDAEARLPKYMAQRAAELLIEKSGLQLKENVTKEVFAAKLVEFLYSTEKRQHLANWFRPAYEKDIQLSEASQDIQELLAKLNDVAGNTQINGKFINKHFPCWTGTLTCFMLNEDVIANKILARNAQRYKDTYLKYENIDRQTGDSDLSSTQKLIRILCLLELIDKWDDVNKITGDIESAPVRPEQYDPYDCVPIPNTVYHLELYEAPQGSCMISTINNLLCILCKNSNKEFKANTLLRSDVQAYIGNLSSITKEDFVSGTTDPECLKVFADVVLPSKPVNRYQPTIALFVLALNELLKLDARVEISSVQTRMLYDNVMPINLLIDIFKRITGHHEKLSVNFICWPKGEKKTKTWPEYKLEIIDEVVNKKVIIGLGKAGGGEHIEITDIKPIV